jgi:signal transduction histidine kinase
MRDTFLSIAAHELKTPMTSILGYVQLFQRRSQRDGYVPERDQRILHIINEQVIRLNKMVQALLDISRIETGQLAIQRAPLDICALARRVVEEIQAAEDTHTLHFSCPGKPLIVQGDELRLEQVLQNLIQNAIKYSPSNEPITVVVEQHGDQVGIAIADHGIGIPQADLPNLFQRFYRANNVEEQHISGMGIGLYVVKEIITLHGGQVEVESAEGAGSTFTFYLPLEDKGVAMVDAD